MNKYRDPSYAEYMRQANLTQANKQTTVQSPFLISSLQPATKNWRPAANGYSHINGTAGNVMNININPMNELSGDVTAECDSDEEQHLQVMVGEWTTILDERTS